MMINQRSMLSRPFILYLLTFFILSCGTGSAQLPFTQMQFPAGKDVVEIPFTRDHGWIILKVKVNNSKELSFILDSGSPVGLLLDDTLADSIGISTQGEINVKGSDGGKGQPARMATGVSFRIGELEINNGLLVIGAAKKVAEGIDGIIGKYLF